MPCIRVELWLSKKNSILDGNLLLQEMYGPYTTHKVLLPFVSPEVPCWFCIWHDIVLCRQLVEVRHQKDVSMSAYALI